MPAKYRSTVPYYEEEKKTGANDRRKFKKDDDKAEGGADEARKQANKHKPCYQYRQGVCKRGDRCEFKHDQKDKEQLVMMVEQRVQGPAGETRGRCHSTQ